MPAIVQDLQVKIKGLLKDERTFLTILLILVATASFGLGRQSVDLTEVGATKSVVAKTKAISEPPVSDPALSERAPATPAASTYYVASKSGEAYHLPYCGGAARIKEENKIYFKSKAEAEAAGYRPAANCPGL